MGNNLSRNFSLVAGKFSSSFQILFIYYCNQHIKMEENVQEKKRLRMSIITIVIQHFQLNRTVIKPSAKGPPL